MELFRGSKQQNVEMGEDRISRLPDCLLHHILSFLDMIYVLRTSILSTRWRLLWISLPSLNFDADEFYKAVRKKNSKNEDTNKRFVIFVDHVLLLHDNSNIQRFSLACCQNDETIECLSSWIDAVVRRNVQEFHLSALSAKCLPDNLDGLFTCKSLIKLRLRFDGRCLLCLPQTISLPCIKTIHLLWLGFTDGISTSRLFSSCPLLESLTIEECGFPDFEELTVDLPRLQHFAVIREDYYIPDLYFVVKIKLYAPSLKSFVCDVPIQTECYLYQCSSLEKVDLNLRSYCYYLEPEYAEEIEERKEEYGQQLRQFLESISMVKALTLSDFMVELLSNPPAILESLPMNLHNLRYLKLDVCPTRECITGVMHLLKISPSLESLILKFTKCNGYHHLEDPYFDEDKSDLVNVREPWEVLSSPQCMLNHLKYVEMHNIEGRAIELNFLKFLHEAALVLKKIRVFTCESHTTEKRLRKFNTKLLTFTRASPSLAVFVS